MMRVALISNTAWLDEELTTFQQLVEGLVGEGLQVVQIMPEGLGRDDAFCFGEYVGWSDSAWSMVRTLRLAHLGKRLEEMNVNLVHALDGRVWLGALRLGRQLNVPVVLGASSRLDIPLIHSLRGAIWRDRPTFTATTQPLGEALRHALGNAATTVEIVLPGVSTFDETPGPGKRSEDVLCAAICGNGVFDGDCAALFEAMAPVIADYPQAQFFLDGQRCDQHPLWQAARKYGLLTNMSMVPRRLGRRELLLMADLIIQPQAMGRSRGLTLHAMARGLPVLACSDPWVDYLIDDETAWLIDRPDPQRWEGLLRRAITEAALARQLGSRARQWVRGRYSLAGQVGRTAGLYRQVTGQSIRFPGAERQPQAS